MCVCVCAWFGWCRSGKSLFAGFLAGIWDEVVFPLGHGAEGKTRGLWCLVAETVEDVVLVVDCEGLQDIDASRVRVHARCLYSRCRVPPSSTVMLLVHRRRVLTLTRS